MCCSEVVGSVWSRKSVLRYGLPPVGSTGQSVTFKHTHIHIKVLYDVCLKFVLSLDPSVYIFLFVQLGGIPLCVFQAAKARLAFTKQLTLRVPLVADVTCGRGFSDSKSGPLNLADVVSEAVYASSRSFQAGSGSCQAEADATISMAARVRLDHLSSQRLHQVK